MSFPFLSGHFFMLDLNCQVPYKSAPYFGGGGDWGHRQIVCMYSSVIWV